LLLKKSKAFSVFTLAKYWPKGRELQTEARAYWRERDRWTGRRTMAGRPDTNTSLHARYPERRV